jgi:GNAT superfamily N-acetyltransferase
MDRVSGASGMGTELAVTIRPAAPGDCAALLELIRSLARYEKLLHTVIASEQDLHAALFGPRPYCEALVAWADGAPAGYALYFHTYSTFLGRPGLWLEDLFVEPAWRRRGIGTALLAEVARLAEQRGCGRLEWSVLDWNESAIEFYRRLGAQVLPDWRICRVTAEHLAALAARG